MKSHIYTEENVSLCAVSVFFIFLESKNIVWAWNVFENERECVHVCICMLACVCVCAYCLCICEQYVCLCVFFKCFLCVRERDAM